MRLRTPLALSLLLVNACGDDKDPMVTTTVPTAPASESGSTDEGSTDGVTSGDDSSSSQTSPTTMTDPTTTAGSLTNMTTDPSSSTTTADPTMTTMTSMTTDPSTTTTADPTMTTDPSTTGDPDEAATQLCVDTINMYRATLGLPALARWTDAEACADAEAQADGEANKPHGTFGMCGESAQNECPGWPAPPETMIEGCLAQMWAEGPGDDFQTHGHYINMSNPAYTKVACGFAIVNGQVWAAQDFQ